MDEEEDDDTEIAIAATCLLLSCSALVAITAKEHKRRRSTWVRNYLRKRHVYSVYTALLPDFFYHKEKFRNFLRMDIATFEELFALVEPSITKQTTRFR